MYRHTASPVSLWPKVSGLRSGCPSSNLSVSLRSTAPLVGEPLAKRQSFAECQGLPSVGEVARRRRDGEVEPSKSFPVRLSFVQPLSLLRRQGRVAAPSVCCAVACILLAAAPTATPCFRRWQRSSPLPLIGEPLAKRQSFAECQGLPSVGEVARRRRDGEVEPSKSFPVRLSFVQPLSLLRRQLPW